MHNRTDDSHEPDLGMPRQGELSAARLSGRARSELGPKFGQPILTYRGEWKQVLGPIYLLSQLGA